MASRLMKLRPSLPVVTAARNKLFLVSTSKLSSPSSIVAPKEKCMQLPPSTVTQLDSGMKVAAEDIGASSATVVWIDVRSRRQTVGVFAVRHYSTKSNGKKKMVLGEKETTDESVSIHLYRELQKELSVAIAERARAEEKLELMTASISLTILRNRIDDLEVKFGVANLKKEVLKKDLELSTTDTQIIYQKVVSHIVESKKQGSFIFEYNNEVDDVVNDESKKYVESLCDATLSEFEIAMASTVAVKASLHYLRWKFIFKHFKNHVDIKTMLNYISTHDRNENDICLELGYLFIKLSTAGVHLLDVPMKVGVNSIKRGLAMKDMDDETTIITVDTLYSIKCSMISLWQRGDLKESF